MAPELEKEVPNKEFFPSAVSLFYNPYYIIRSRLVDNIRLIAPRLKGSVLDFGCGSKPYERLFTAASSYVGVDVELSGHNHENSKVDFFYKDGTLPFDDASFDNVVSFEVFEHVINLEAMIPELVRVLRPDGNLLITVPFMYPEHEVPFDFRRITVNGVQAMVENHGFELIESVKYPSGALCLAQLISHFIFTSLSGRSRFVKAVAHLGLSVPLQVLAIMLSKSNRPTDMYLGSVILLKKNSDRT